MAVLTRSTNKKNKHFILDQTTLDRAKKTLGTKTETETIERALEIAMTEAERNELAWSAHEEFFRSAKRKGVEIVDVFGRMEKD